MAKERWTAAVDSVGGQTLATVLSQVKYGGWVAACGLAGGTDLPASVFPFILRNVSLLGVDSVMAPMHRRKRAWWQLAKDLPKDKLAAMTEVHPLSEIFEQIGRASCRERVCQYGQISVVAVALKTKQKKA